MNNVLRNITPAIAVMVAGLAGAYLVYDNFFSTKNDAGTVAMIAPAAGEVTDESIIIAEASALADAAAVAVETTDAPVATTTEVAPDGSKVLRIIQAQEIDKLIGR